MIPSVKVEHAEGSGTDMSGDCGATELRGTADGIGEAETVEGSTTASEVDEASVETVEIVETEGEEGLVLPLLASRRRDSTRSVPTVFLFSADRFGDLVIASSGDLTPPRTLPNGPQPLMKDPSG